MAIAQGSSATRARSQEPSCVRQSADRQWHLVAYQIRCAVARSAREVGQMELCLSAIPAMEPLRAVGRAAGCSFEQRGGTEDSPDDRQHCDPRPPSGSRRKKGTQKQALGGSCGGFTSKIHARTNGVGLPLGFVLTPGEAHDATAYDALMQTDDDHPKALLADRGYDTDAIGARFTMQASSPAFRQSPRVRPASAGTSASTRSATASRG